MAVQDLKHALQAAKKKKGKKGKKVGQVKADSVGLEGFVDWVNPIPPTGETQGVRPIPHIARDTTKKRNDNMYNLAVRFASRMCKRATSTQEETTPGSKVPGDKSLKRLGLDEDIQKI